jgi:hypothetical protein
LTRSGLKLSDKTVLIHVNTGTGLER